MAMTIGTDSPVVSGYISPLKIFEKIEKIEKIEICKFSQVQFISNLIESDWMSHFIVC